jgi:hypothetical protein
VEGIRLPGRVAEAAVQPQGPGRAGGGGGDVLGLGLHGAQQHQRAGLAGPVAGLAGGGVQVGALGLQPAGRLLEGGDRRRAGGRAARQRRAFGVGPSAGPSALVQEGKCPPAARAVCR